MYQYLQNNNKQNMQNNKDITKYKITILGNTGVGKSTFLSNISTKKLKHQNQFNINDTTIDLHVLGKDYKIHLIQLAAKSVDIHKQQNISNICNNSNIILIFFDISNIQSFLEIGRKWIKIIQKQMNNVQNIILIANKIDKQGMSLKNLFQYANKQGVQLFFMDKDMDCKKILSNIVLAYQYKVQCQRLRKLNMQSPKKLQGFFKKIFGSNSQSVQQKQSKAQVKKLQQNYLQRLYQIKKSFHNAENQIKKQIKQIISILNIEIVKKQNNQMQVLLQSIKNKIKQLQKIKQQQQQMHLKAQSKCIQLNDQINNIKKQLYKKSQLQQQLKQKLNNKQKQNKILHQKSAAIFQLYNKQKLQNKKLKQQHAQKLLQKKKQMQKLQKQHEQLNRNHLYSTIGQSQLSKNNQQYKQQVHALQQTIEQIYNREMFWEVYAFRNMSIQLIKQFSNNILQVQKNKQIKKCQKIYQYDLCSFVDFRYYLHKKSNLLYVIELQNNFIIVYAAQIYHDMSAGKIGCFMVWNKTDVMRKLKIKDNGDIWRYNPVNLVYGNKQIYVKFMKNKCTLQLIDKNKTIFTQKYQHIAQLLQLPHNDNLQYDLKSLQIFKLDFKSL